MALNRHAVQKAICDLEGFTSTEKALLFVISIKCHKENGRFFMSAENAAAAAGCSAKTARRTLEKLIASEILTFEGFTKSQRPTKIYRFDLSKLYNARSGHHAGSGHPDHGQIVHQGTNRDPGVDIEGARSGHHDHQYSYYTGIRGSAPSEIMEYPQWFAYVRGWSDTDPQAQAEVKARCNEQITKVIEMYGGFSRTYQKLNTINDYQQTAAVKMLNAFLSKVQHD
jgi:hypothetical protein